MDTPVTVSVPENTLINFRGKAVYLDSLSQDELVAFALDRNFEALVAQSLVKELLRNEQRVLASNEWQRHLQSWANKTGFDRDYLADYLEPILRSLMDEMLQRKQKKARRS